MSRLKDLTKALRPAKPVAKVLLKSALKALEVSKDRIIEAREQLNDLITEVRADMARTNNKPRKIKPVQKKAQRRRSRAR